MSTQFHSEYKGWIVWTRNVHGMWTATNFTDGYGQVSADTLAGLRQAITATIRKAGATR